MHTCNIMDRNSKQKASTTLICVIRCMDVFAEALKVASDKQLAIMIAKGVERFPDNGDRVAGNIDIWWILRILPIMLQFCFSLADFLCLPLRLRSASSSDLMVPRTIRSAIGERSFQSAAASTWNALPRSLRFSTSVLQFRSRLKTELFACSYQQSYILNLSLRQWGVKLYSLTHSL